MSSYNFDLSKKTHIFHLKVWVLLTVFLGIFLVLVLWMLWCCIAKKKFRRKATLPITQIRKLINESKEIKVIKVDPNSAINGVEQDKDNLVVPGNYTEKDSQKLLVHFKKEKEMDKEKKSGGNKSKSRSFRCFEKEDAMSHPATGVSSPLAGLPELSHLGWGHWFTLRDLEVATDKFSKDNVIGEGGYGVVYRGRLINGTIVAVKRLLNNL